MKILNKIIAWIHSLAGSLEDDFFDVYKPKERNIYSYYNGEGMVACDPILLYKSLMKHGPSLSIDIKVANSPSKGAEQAHDSMVKTIREIFSVKPLEEGGLTEAETVGLLDHFLIYSERIKKNSSPSATIWTPTPPSAISGEGQPTSSTTGSGSADGESPTAGPAMSRPEPQSP